MQDTKRGIRAMWLALTVLCLCLAASLPASADADGKLTAQTSLDEISHFGNVGLVGEKGRILEKDLAKAGIARGDTVKVSFLDKTLEMVVGGNIFEAEVGSPLLRIKEDAVQLSINMGDFASKYIADKTTLADDSIKWHYKDGIEPPVVFTIERIRKGETKGDNTPLVYTDERADYPNLSDEAFANFRMVDAGNIKEGVLYRTSSPIDPTHKRSTYADAALKQAGVASVLNLADSREKAESFAGYEKTYYASIDSLAVSMKLSYESEDFSEKLAEGLIFLAGHEPPYAVHCQEGKDRTGIVTALIACFMGATFEEVKQDYMLTFYNYYGIKPGDAAYDEIVEKNIVRALSKLLGEKDPEHADLAGAAADYFAAIGLTEEEMETLREKLGQAGQAALRPAA